MSLLTSCNKTELPIQEGESFQSINANIQPRRLFGNWQLSEMLADIPVDLNGDGTGNTNLLLETDCFDDMRIEFFQDGTFFTENAQMDFAAGASDNEFECLSGRDDIGTWEINRNELILTILVDGVLYTDTKIIKLTGNRFSFEVTEEESDIYVNDPGNTLVSDVQILELEYSRGN